MSSPSSSAAVRHGGRPGATQILIVDISQPHGRGTWSVSETGDLRSLTHLESTAYVKCRIRKLLILKDEKPIPDRLPGPRPCGYVVSQVFRRSPPRRTRPGPPRSSSSTFHNHTVAVLEAAPSRASRTLPESKPQLPVSRPSDRDTAFCLHIARPSRPGSQYPADSTIATLASGSRE